jgi:hypothetical protein
LGQQRRMWKVLQRRRALGMFLVCCQRPTRC